MGTTSDKTITQLLERLENGDQQAFDSLYQAVAGKLKVLAASYLQRERPGHLLQATMLVDDALVQLIGKQGAARVQNRVHFFRAAARAMRHLLVDHERQRRRQKRGGGEYRRAEMEPDELVGQSFRWDLLALDEALEKLRALDPRQSEVVDLHHFGGWSLDETADMLAVSRTTVKNEWAAAKAWLYRELRNVEPHS